MLRNYLKSGKSIIIEGTYGDASTLHRYFQAWVAEGVFGELWALIVQECEDLGKVDWEWQSADGTMGKARMGGDAIGPNPTDRAKNGTKRSILVEAGGGPLSMIVAAANVHDTKLLAETLQGVVVTRPRPTRTHPQNLCLDKGYDNPTGRAAALAGNYWTHIRHIGEEKIDSRKRKRLPACRWVVERTHAWLSKCRAVLVRYGIASK